MNFDSIYKVYDLIYSKKDYLSESNHVIEYLSKIKNKDVLEYGIGSGNHALCLREKGYVVTGVERNKFMNQIAQKKGFNSINEDMIHFNSNLKYPNAIALFHVFSYITEWKELNIFFKNLNQNLVEGGYFIFDAWFTPSVYNIKPSKRIKTVKSDSFEIKRKSTPNINYLKNTVEVLFNFEVYDSKENKSYDFQENHLMRHYSITEIVSLCEQHGFEYIISEEIITKNKPSLNTWSLLHVIRKK